MNLIIKTLISRFGWNAIFKGVWMVGKPYLKKLAAKSRTQIDDQAIDLIDDLISGVSADARIAGISDRVI